MARILVTGVGGPDGRNTAILLLERGHTVIGTDMREVSLPDLQFHRISPAHAASFLDELYCLALDERVCLLIPTVSEELPILATRRDPWDGIKVALASYEAVNRANDKYLTGQCLSLHGVSVPRYVLPSQVASAADIVRCTGWPCVSKPRVGRGGREVIVHGEDGWSAITALDDRYILQEFVPGTDYAPELFVAEAGNSTPAKPCQSTVVVLEKTKLKGGLVGNAEEVRRVAAPDVADLALSAARAMGLTGPLDIDIRRRADGQPVVLEINARLGANIAHAPEVLDALLLAYGI